MSSSARVGHEHDRTSLSRLHHVAQHRINFLIYRRDTMRDMMRQHFLHLIPSMRKAIEALKGQMGTGALAIPGSVS